MRFDIEYAWVAWLALYELSMHLLLTYLNAGKEAYQPFVLYLTIDETINPDSFA
jgi:hypothetical protein